MTMRALCNDIKILKGLGAVYPSVANYFLAPALLCGSGNEVSIEFIYLPKVLKYHSLILLVVRIVL